MRATSFEEEMNRSERFMPQITSDILEPRPWLYDHFRPSSDDGLVIHTANPFEDRCQATDLIITSQWPGVAAGVRVRRHTPAVVKNDDMAIRTMGSDGRPRELQHILSGFAQLDVYAVADPTDTRLWRVWLVDLRKFADYAHTLMDAGMDPPWTERANGRERFVTVDRKTLIKAGALLEEIWPGQPPSKSGRLLLRLLRAQWFRLIPRDLRAAAIADLTLLAGGAGGGRSGVANDGHAQDDAA